MQTKKPDLTLMCSTSLPAGSLPVQRSAFRATYRAASQGAQRCRHITQYHHAIATRSRLALSKIARRCQHIEARYSSGYEYEEKREQRGTESVGSGHSRFEQSLHDQFERFEDGDRTEYQVGCDETGFR